MPIRFQCESCDARMKVPEGSVGLRVKCPRCGRMQAVPAESEPARVLAMAGAGGGSAEPGRRLSKSERKQMRKQMAREAMAKAGMGDDKPTPLVFQSTPEAGKLAGGLERVGGASRYPKFSKPGVRSWFRSNRARQPAVAPRSTTNRPAGGTGPLSRPGLTFQTGRTYRLLQGLSWSLRAASVVLIPGAVKVMLVVFDATGSAVVAGLALVTGLAICAMLLTIGEIAAAVRQLARPASAC